MSKIASVFARSGQKALIGYVTTGFPDANSTLDIVPVLASSGCDLVELGIPFSDPLADGATIQKASHEALSRGVTPGVCLDIASKVSTRTEVPLVFMTYYNPVLHYGLAAFCRDSASAGISGLIIPDLPPEEAEELDQAAAACGLDLIYLLAPTSTSERIELVASKSRGFIYLVSLTGVTGAREALPSGLESFVLRVRQETSTPLCVGFGISTPEQARRVAAVADGVIVGSRLIQCMTGPDPILLVRQFIGGLRQALDENSTPGRKGGTSM